MYRQNLLAQLPYHLCAPRIATHCAGLPNRYALPVTASLHTFLPYFHEDIPALLLRSRTAPRANLSAGLVAYLKRMGAPSAAIEAAQRLAHPESRAVVSGQQAGLLTGPSFTFYKAHSALDIARQHHTPERPVVAVFWVASQDHDTEEIRSVNLLDLHEKTHRLSLELPPSHPAGRIPFAPYQQQVRELLQNFAGRPDIRQRILQALDGEWSYSEVFARLMLEFLGPEGLVVLDPMAPELAPLFAPTLREELTDPLASSEAINQTARAMHEAGLEPGLGRGEAATNLFLEGDDQIRRLLRYRNGHFEDGQNQYSRQDLEAIVLEEPTRLTPGAGLRPVVQDAVLPTLAFVVGPSEMKYVAELGQVYRLHGLEAPAVVQRLHATVLEPPIQRILNKYGLDAWAFQANPEQRFEQALSAQNQQVQQLHGQLKHIEQAFVKIQNSLSDPTLERPRQRARVRITHELERLQHKILQSQLRQDTILSAQFERLRLHLTPSEYPQERFYPFVMYLLKHGPVMLGKLDLIPGLGKHLLKVD